MNKPILVRYAFLYLLFICCYTKINAQSIICTTVGDSVAGYSGDNGLAKYAELNGPHDVCLDAAGNLYIADMRNHVIRKVTAATGIITTIAGTGTAGYSGDDGLAVNAEITSPSYMCLDAAGNLYFSDGGQPVGGFFTIPGNCTVRKITMATGKISTVAGNGLPGYTGDNGLATSAELECPQGICLDAQGNLYIADWSSNCIRKVTVSTGIITTIAGGLTGGHSGDNGPASLALLGWPGAMCINAAGDIYFSDWNGTYIRKISAITGIITEIAGNGGASYSGDNGPAVNAGLENVTGMCFDCHGDLYCDDWSCSCRKIDMLTGIINRIAGDSVLDSFSGDNGPSLNATLDFPAGLCVDPHTGNIIIADYLNSRIRMATQPGFVQIATQVNNITLSSQPTIFPNPSTGKFCLKVSEDQKFSTMEIFDVVGNIVNASVLVDTKTNVDLSSFPSGVYLISIKSETGVYTQRIVITK